MVKVKYLGNIGMITGRKSEEFDVESLSKLVEEIGKKYGDRKEIQYYFAEPDTTDPSFIILLNGQIVKNVSEYREKLKEGDEITLMTIIAGG